MHAYNVGTFINLPFSNFIDNFSIQIMAYIGLSVIIAYLSALIFDGLEKIHHGFSISLRNFPSLRLQQKRPDKNMKWSLARLASISLDCYNTDR